MQIGFKNFEAKTDTISANRISAEVTSGIYVDLFKNGMLQKSLYTHKSL